MPHEGPLDPEWGQHICEQGKGDELPGGQAARQETPPVEVREVEEGGKEGICVGQVQGGQELHAKDVEGCLQERLDCIKLLR